MTIKARGVHPKMRAHGLKVKTAHAHLTKTVPNFTRLAPAQRMQAVQDHIRRTT